MRNITNILIWDLDKNPCNSDRSIILWSGLSENEIFFSITKFVEDNSLLLRTKYLKWVFELGEININGKSLIENLKIRENLSFWWLTQISEKCNFAKSPQIDNVIKLFAFKILGLIVIKSFSIGTFCPFIFISNLYWLK